MRESRWLIGLERAVLVLFVLTLAVLLVRLAGWGPDWWLTAWQICGVAFGLTLLMYLSAGGGRQVAESKVGMVGLVLLGLIVTGNLAEALFDIDSPVWDVAWNAVAVGFLVCFVAYVVIRLSQRTRSHDSTR
jgi:hypothetical protein